MNGKEEKNIKKVKPSFNSKLRKVLRFFLVPLLIGIQLAFLITFIYLIYKDKTI